jgi:hypothetical protein
MSNTAYSSSRQPACMRPRWQCWRTQRQLGKWLGGVSWNQNCAGCTLPHLMWKPVHSLLLLLVVLLLMLLLWRCCCCRSVLVNQQTHAIMHERCAAGKQQQQAEGCVVT